MKINEIFCSINGESRFAGLRTVFVRTFGCNILCNYCDTLYAVKGDDFKEMAIYEIIREVDKYECKRVTLTGGEPMLQRDALDLIDALIHKGYTVEVETNGAVDLANLVGKNYGNRLLITMDWKCPGSGMRDKMIDSNLEILTTNNVVKCVVSDKADLEEIKRIHSLTWATVYVSPVFGRIEPKEIAEYIINEKLNDVVCQLQIHKFIWSADTRGV